MIEAQDAIVWVNHDTKEVRVLAKGSDRGEIRRWRDEIGAANSQWREMRDNERVLLMLETAIDLAMQGYDLGDVLRAFAEVKQFRALGSSSQPMCRALTSALIGERLELNTMSFEELLESYPAKRR